MATNTLTTPWWRYLRISLRGLIVLVLAFGGGLGWIVNRAKVRLDAVTAIERVGGSVKYEWEWKDGQFKDNSSLHTLVLSGTNVTDAGVFRLQKALPELKIVR